MGKEKKWIPSLGSICNIDGTTFRVWAPDARQLDLCLQTETGLDLRPLNRGPDGNWSAYFSDVRAGERYWFRLNEDRILPDPASRFQPDGVHGPSEVIDPNLFPWNDQDWRGVKSEDAIIYELHVGAFTNEGTFRAVEKRLDYLAHLGITVIELMPLGDFPGSRNWGYDGVALFAPARCYGTPDDLRSLVNAAHRCGIAVLLDVVYNHFGPDGAYAPSFSPHYFSNRYKTFWGEAINFDGTGSSFVRDFFIENALYWLHEFHMDGFRLDATHSIRDTSDVHFIAELAARLRAQVHDREVLLIAEDHRNMATIVRDVTAQGWGLDAVWSDDFHHAVRRYLAGDQEGYFQDFKGSTAELKVILQRGWLYMGEYSRYYKEPRGSDPAGLRPENFVFFLQNHDQVGNRARGERLNHQIDPASYRAASALFLCAPEIPLLFMGQEYGASSPFLYFTDHQEELGRNVRNGRLKEFQQFREFADQSNEVPDPQAMETFLASQLRWIELEEAEHAPILKLHQALIHVRKTYLKSLLLRRADCAGEHSLILEFSDSNQCYKVALHLQGQGSVELPGILEVLMSTEDPEFSADPLPVRLVQNRAIFSRPGALIIRCAL